MSTPQPSDSPVLIFRTVSIEKMDAVLAACRARWPQAPLAVLSSPNRKAELLADPRVAEVVSVVLGPEGFPPRLGLSRRFAAVVVPLGNRRGSGYANVFTAARSCSTGGHFLARYCAELQSVSRTGLWLRSTAETLLLALALPFAWLAAALLVPRDPR
jgi:hypothetical protein